MTDPTPTPLTDFTRRATAARDLIHSLLTELIGPVDLKYDFFREWNGCWRARVDISGSVTGGMEFTFLTTPGGGLLALPRPLPERWRQTTGIPADDGTRWTLNDTGLLVPFFPVAADPSREGGAQVGGSGFTQGPGVARASGPRSPAPVESATSLSRRERLVLFLAQGLGSGRAPWAPGTFGTLPGVALYLLLAGLSLGPYLAVTLVLLLIGIPLCGRAARTLGRTDPPSVVWDEIVGFLITMIATPPGWATILAGFAAFRLFDIWKPWPIRWVDRRVGGGLGIMLDDVLAGLMALALIQIGQGFVTG